jgi:hypothetical protein
LGRRDFYNLLAPLPLPSLSSFFFFTTLFFYLNIVIMDNEFDGAESEAFSVCSSPLSTALDTAVLEASSNATDGNALNLNSEQTTNGDYVKAW